MAKYLLTFIAEQRRIDSSSPEEMRGAMEAWNAFDKEAIDAGAMIACEPLRHVSEAKTMRIADDGERVTTDGPFAETKEQLGGFCLLEVKDLDEALEWAAKVPVANKSAIEVREVMDLTEFGFDSPTAGPVKAKATA